MTFFHNILETDSLIPKYKLLSTYLRESIKNGTFKTGDYLPSENEICDQFNITRTTARKALDELLMDGLIVKEHGKGSRVLKKKKSLGLLAAKGFSEVAGTNVETRFLEEPKEAFWDKAIPFDITPEEKQYKVFRFKRLRLIDSNAIMVDTNWLAPPKGLNLNSEDFVEGSLFKTLSQKFQLEIRGSEQILTAIAAPEELANLLQVAPGAPILKMWLRFETSDSKINIYTEAYYETSTYPIANAFRANQ